MYLTQSLHRATQQSPDNPYSVHAGRVLTHRQVMDRVARIAGALRSLGVSAEDRVGVLGLNTDTYLQLLLAVPWADAVLVPVNIRWSVKEMAYSLEDSGVEVLLLDDAFAPLGDALREAAPGLRELVHCGDAPTPEGMHSLTALVAESSPVPDVHRRGDALAGIFYTGGTTGFPKGVMLSHRNILASCLGALAGAAEMTSGGRILHVAPVFHLAAFASWVEAGVLGLTHVLLPGFDPVQVLTTIEEQQVTDVLLVPTMIQLVVDHPRVAEFDLSSVDHLVYGASPISEALLDRARTVLPTATFTQAYGMTELSPVATILDDDAHRDPALRVSAGRAAPHALVRIVDPEGSEVPRGTVGEIAVAGEHVMLGYWNKPEETAAALRDGWMHTGDGGYMDEHGYVFIADRIKDMIISGGENVYSVEVENAVAKHPAVTQVAVIGVPDEEWGERVHAVVSLAPGAELTAEELRDHCRAEIAGYKCPRSLEIVTEFPMSAAGKILKRDLRARHQS